MALLAEQQLRKSAEGRLGAELRKAIKLSAINQELSSSNTKLQQLLREAKAEVSACRIRVTKLREHSCPADAQTDHGMTAVPCHTLLQSERLGAETTCLRMAFKVRRRL